MSKFLAENGYRIVIGAVAILILLLIVYNFYLATITTGAFN